MADVEAYIASAKLKTERDRQADVKNVTGCFTGAYVLHPFTGDKVPVWIGEYVLASYGTGAVMAVPAGDQRDWDFAKKFDLPIPAIFEGADISEKAESSKEAVLCASDFLNGLRYKEATQRIIARIRRKRMWLWQSQFSHAGRRLQSSALLGRTISYFLQRQYSPILGPA